MTKEELKQQIEAIKKQYGEPSSPYDEPNESYKQITELRTQYRMQALANSRALKKSELNELAEQISPSKRKEYLSSPALPVYVTEEDMRPFDEMEQGIIKCWLDEQTQTNKQVANRTGNSIQKVTSTLRLPAFSALMSRVGDSHLKLENFIALRKAQLDGDSKIIVALAQKYGNLEKDSLDITNKSKPIEDPLIIKLLKNLGDKAM